MDIIICLIIFNIETTFFLKIEVNSFELLKSINNMGLSTNPENIYFVLKVRCKETTLQNNTV